MTAPPEIFTENWKVLNSPSPAFKESVSWLSALAPPAQQTSALSPSNPLDGFTAMFVSTSQVTGLTNGIVVVLVVVVPQVIAALPREERPQKDTHGYKPPSVYLSLVYIVS
mmetsp:Transcript_44431/g.73848  ORF Transcript_44431/g.73848 Transcript_44431/m.73848 type:complete len:111 (-) Transcript_44431:828-1160(-)